MHSYENIYGFRGVLVFIEELRKWPLIDTKMTYQNGYLINFWAKMRTLHYWHCSFGAKIKSPFLVQSYRLEKEQCYNLFWLIVIIFGRMLPLIRYKVTGFERKMPFLV